MRSFIHSCIGVSCIALSPAGAQTPSTAPATSQATSLPAQVAVTPIAHVEKRGDGPIAMILIPGLSCDWTVFETFMERNKHKYTMLAVTLPGFGGSAAPPPPANDQFGAWLNNADAALWKLIDDQGIASPVIVGHSLGGHLALRMGTEHPAALRAVIAIDGAPAFPFGKTPAEQTKAQRLTMAKQMAAMYSTVPAEQWTSVQGTMVSNMVTDRKRAAELTELCLKVPQGTTVQYMVDLVAADIRDQLPKLTVPTLVTPSVNSRDAALIAANHQMWTRLMTGAPNVQLAFFEDTRHFIQDDRPAELDAAIEDFLAGRQARGYEAPATQPASQPVEHQ